MLLTCKEVRIYIYSCIITHTYICIMEPKYREWDARGGRTCSQQYDVWFSNGVYICPKTFWGQIFWLRLWMREGMNWIELLMHLSSRISKTSIKMMPQKLARELSHEIWAAPCSPTNRRSCACLISLVLRCLQPLPKPATGLLSRISSIRGVGGYLNMRGTDDSTAKFTVPICLFFLLVKGRPMFWRVELHFLLFIFCL